MKSIRFASILTLILGTFFYVGCSNSADDSTGKEPTNDTVETSSNASTALLDLGNQTARATQIGEDGVGVDLYALDGQKQFRVEFRLGTEQDETILWTSYDKSDAELLTGAESSGTLSVELETLPELDAAIEIAYYIFKKVKSGQNGTEFDNWGCDLLPGKFNKITSCGLKGRCCDMHDACYAKHHCKSSSWVKPWPLASAACKACNAAAVVCFAGANPGPSACCFKGNCGKPR
jgi:hypothetical protein